MKKQGILYYLLRVHRPLKKLCILSWYKNLVPVLINQHKISILLSNFIISGPLVSKIEGAKMQFSCHSYRTFSFTVIEVVKNFAISIEWYWFSKYSRPKIKSRKKNQRRSMLKCVIASRCQRLLVSKYVFTFFFLSFFQKRARKETHCTNKVRENNAEKNNVARKALSRYIVLIKKRSQLQLVCSCIYLTPEKLTGRGRQVARTNKKATFFNVGRSRRIFI